MRLPIRLRLTAAYAVLLAAILVALGVFLVLQLRAGLRGTIDREVRANSAQIGRGYAAEGPEDFRDVSQTILPATAAAQVIDSAGRVLVAYGDLARAGPIVSAQARAAAFAGRPRVVTVVLGERRPQRFRALVSPVQRGGRPRVLVVAKSLAEAERSVQRVLVLLLLAGPAALGAGALAGWWLARRALAPVERMTAQAQAIGIDRLNERIALPRARDEIGNLAVTLNAMLDRLERGVTDKQRLLADASHELRTPLAVMRTELDVSLLADDLSAPAREVLESVREEVDRMSRTVANLLTLAAVDEGRLELLTSQVDLREAIDAAARPLRPLAAAKGVRFEVDGTPCAARADPQRLHQALTNFIENAIKFARPGGAVLVHGWCEDDEVGVTVTDDGPGLPAGAHERVFDRFYRVDDARGREVGGSGLGLAICREVAVAHGGRVWVDSEEGGGSAFSLALPRTPEH